MDVFADHLILKGKVITLKSLPDPDAHIDMQKILNCPITMRNLSYMCGDWTIDDVNKRYEGFYRDSQKKKSLTFFIYSNADGRMIGNTRFTEISLFHKWTTLGWIIDHQYWRTGASYECYYLLWKLAIEEMGLNRIEFGTFKENTPIHKAMEMIGIKLESIKKQCFFDEGMFKDNYIYALFAEDWPIIKAKLEAKIDQKVNNISSS